ncbi:MAG: hypothetical protein ACLRZ7_02380 [Lachnospiraceae bacterium]
MVGLGTVYMVAVLKIGQGCLLIGQKQQDQGLFAIKVLTTRMRRGSTVRCVIQDKEVYLYI